MRFRPLTRPIRSPRWARTAGVVALLMLIWTTILSSAGVITLNAGLASLGVSAALAGLAILLAATGIHRVWMDSGPGITDAGLGIAYSLPVVLACGVLGYFVTQVPAYPDLATNVNDPPALPSLSNTSGALPLDEADAEERIRLQLAHPDLATLFVERPGWHVADLVDQLANANGWRFIEAYGDVGENYLVEYSVPGPFLVVRHGVSLRIVDDGVGSVIDGRSYAPIPLHDFGTNSQVLTSVLEQLLLTIQATPPPASDL